MPPIHVEAGYTYLAYTAWFIVLGTILYEMKTLLELILS